MKTEEFYNLIKAVLKITKNSEMPIIMGDFNTKVGEGSEEDIVGHVGLTQRTTEVSDGLVQFCREEKLTLSINYHKGKTSLHMVVPS